MSPTSFGFLFEQKKIKSDLKALETYKSRCPLCETAVYGRSLEENNEQTRLHTKEKHPHVFKQISKKNRELEAK